MASRESLVPIWILHAEFVVDTRRVSEIYSLTTKKRAQKGIGQSSEGCITMLGDYAPDSQLCFVPRPFVSGTRAAGAERSSAALRG